MAAARDRSEADAPDGTADSSEVVVERSASLYVARRELTDPTLQPYDWYHGHVLRGAVEHGLPDDYVEFLRSFHAIEDTLE